MSHPYNKKIKNYCFWDISQVNCREKTSFVFLFFTFPMLACQLLLIHGCAVRHKVFSVRCAMFSKQKMVTGITGLVLTIFLEACSQPLSHREKGTLIGGGAGAAGGALIGGMMGAPGTGALVGGAAGAVGGALVGDQKDRRER
jgi:hypothetical protein